MGYLRQIINESTNINKMIFLSTSNMNGKTLNPRIPSNYFTKNGYEDSKIKRVCFAPSIDKALMALSQRCKDMILYVHTPIDNSKLNTKIPSIKQVPDCKITGEIWCLESVKLKCIGKIKVIDDAGKDGHKFIYGNNTAELYDWTWKWIERKNINENPHKIKEMVNMYYSKDDCILEKSLFKNIFNSKKKIDKNEKQTNVQDFLNKDHNVNLKKCIELQPKVIKIISDNYPELLKKKVFKKSNLSDYKSINEKNIKMYLCDNKISYPLVDWDLWTFTPKARDIDESNKFWVIYRDIVKKIKEIFKDNDFTIDDNGDWDSGSIVIEYNKSIKISKEEDLNECTNLAILESNISKYKQIPINNDNINKYKEIYKPLCHVRYDDNYDGIILLDKEDVVGFINIKDKNFIQALEINPKYRGQKISHDLLDLAINKFNAKKLSVRKTNNTAISLYKKHGFKTCDENEYQYIMTLNECTDLILFESNSYKKKYNCPYCNNRHDRQELIKHIENIHKDLIPLNFTPTRIVFNIVNKKDKGRCVQCGKETQWNEENQRYDRYCCEKCIALYKQERDKRMEKVYGKVYLLDDEDFQKKMLEGRSISGTYKFSDGGMRSYVGSYEKNLLEFLDKVMGFHSKDIITPGYTVIYDYNGEKHKWILDVYIVPFNLQIDAKDGGSNPNKRNMPEYRAKQLSKELAIKEQKEFNYLRLTDNDFSQLMVTLLQIKQSLQNTDDDKIVNINEYMAMGSCNKVVSSNSNYIVPCMIQNTFVEPVYSRDKFLDNMYRLVDGKLTLITRSELKKQFDIPTKILKASTSKDKLEELCNSNEYLSHSQIFKELTGHDLLDKNQYFFDDSLNYELEGFYEYDLKKGIIESTIDNKFNIDTLITEQKVVNSVNNLNLTFPLTAKQDRNGYFIENGKTKNRSKSYISINEIPTEVMNLLIDGDDNEFLKDEEFDI